MDILLTGRARGLIFEVVIEVKNTDWDAMAAARVAPNLARHRRQIWGYLEPRLERVDMGELARVLAALVYPRRPLRPARLEQVEASLGSYGITALWYEDLHGELAEH